MAWPCLWQALKERAPWILVVSSQHAFTLLRLNTDHRCSQQPATQLPNGPCSTGLLRSHLLSDNNHRDWDSWYTHLSVSLIPDKSFLEKFPEAKNDPFLGPQIAVLHSHMWHNYLPQRHICSTLPCASASSSLKCRRKIVLKRIGLHPPATRRENGS